MDLEYGSTGATGFRIFKDMMNRTFYKRISKNVNNKINARYDGRNTDHNCGRRKCVTNTKCFFKHSRESYS